MNAINQMPMGLWGNTVGWLKLEDVASLAHTDRRFQNWLHPEGALLVENLTREDNFYRQQFRYLMQDELQGNLDFNGLKKVASLYLKQMSKRWGMSLQEMQEGLASIGASSKLPFFRAGPSSAVREDHALVVTELLKGKKLLVNPQVSSDDQVHPNSKDYKHRQCGFIIEYGTPDQIGKVARSFTSRILAIALPAAIQTEDMDKLNALPRILQFHSNNQLSNQQVEGMVRQLALQCAIECKRERALDWALATSIGTGPSQARVDYALGWAVQQGNKDQLTKFSDVRYLGILKKILTSTIAGGASEQAIDAAYDSLSKRSDSLLHSTKRELLGIYKIQSLFLDAKRESGRGTSRGGILLQGIRGVEKVCRFAASAVSRANSVVSSVVRELADSDVKAL